MGAPPLRVGLIGCGFFAENHLAAWSNMDDVVLTAVCDIDREKARAAADRYKVGAFYGDAAEMFARDQLDFVDIATTMESHASLVRTGGAPQAPYDCAEALAPTFEDCVAIVEGTRAAGIPFMVHENTRFLAPVRKVREIIDSGAIGEPTWARVSFRTGHNIYGKQPYLANVETSSSSTSASICSTSPASSWAKRRASIADASIKPGIRGEDMATILLHHESGATSVVEASYASPIHPDPFPQLRLQVEGRAGSLRLDPGYKLNVFSNGKATKIDVSPAMLPWSTPPWHGSQESVLRVQQHWVRCFREEAPARNLRLGQPQNLPSRFGAYKSARTGDAVDLGK